jgi:hypothetical protein
MSGEPRQGWPRQRPGRRPDLDIAAARSYPDRARLPERFERGSVRYCPVARGRFRDGLALHRVQGIVVDLDMGAEA